MTTTYDAIIVGGGFYGCYLSIFLRKYNKKILVIEKESDIVTRASYTNQARVHNGYHYPRNYITALRSAINFPQFVADFYPAIDHSFEKIYAIARNNSKVTAEQFFTFCKMIHAPIATLSEKDKRLFDMSMIEEAFVVKEFAFDAATVRTILKNRLSKIGIELRVNTHVEKIEKIKGGILAVKTNSGSYEAKSVYVCSYSGINVLLNRSNLPIMSMKHEITEMALVKVPDELSKLAITVMDGPFFSIMPFPDKNLHTLSHVRYTPHAQWHDDNGNVKDPYVTMDKYAKNSKYEYMIHDARRYIPILRNSKFIDSLFEIKTVLVENEMNDGRPILFEKDHGMHGVSVVMGGKIDNIYDVVSAMKKLNYV